VADADEWDPRRADAANARQLGRVQLELDEELGDREAELGPVELVGALAAGDRPHERAPGAGDDPAQVGAGFGGRRLAGSRHRAVGGVRDRAQVGVVEELAGPAEADLLVAPAAPGLGREGAVRLRHADPPAGRPHRVQGREVARLHRGQRLCVLELDAIAGGDRAGEEDTDAGGVLEGPVVQRDAEGGELAGEVVRVRPDVLDPGVDPVAVGLRAGAQRVGELVDHPVDLGVGVIVATGDQVVVEVGRAEDLGEPAGGRALEQLELEEAVLGDRVADAPPAVVLALRGYRGDAVRVADDVHSGPRRLGFAGLAEAEGPIVEVDELVDLVGQVLGAGAVGDARQRDEPALAGRQHRLGLERRRARARGRQRDRRKRRPRCHDPPSPHRRQRTFGLRRARRLAWRAAR
jgi:hypothetical protein